MRKAYDEGIRVFFLDNTNAMHYCCTQRVILTDDVNVVHARASSSMHVSNTLNLPRIF